MIATPSYDGKLSVWYANSLFHTIHLCLQNNVLVMPLWMSYDALIQRSRNDLIEAFMKSDAESVIWIDSDIEWNPEWILKLLLSDKDIIGGTYRKKTDESEEYTVKASEIVYEDNLLKVEGLGFGFIKTSRKAIEVLYNKAEEYESGGKTARNVFEVAIKNGSMVGEDILVCQKFIDAGFNIYLDPTMTCNHVGDKKFVGNFTNFLERLKDKKD